MIDLGQDFADSDLEYLELEVIALRGRVIHLKITFCDGFSPLFDDAWKHPEQHRQ